MNDMLIGFFLGAAAASIVAVLCLLFRAWQRGNSRDTLPDGVEAVSEPDLSRAITEDRLVDAAKRVLNHAVPMAQLAATMPQARWRMAAGNGYGSVELPVREAFFLDVERLDIAMRSYDGVDLSEHDQAVLLGVVAPNRFGANSMPTLLLDDAT